MGNVKRRAPFHGFIGSWFALAVVLIVGVGTLATTAVIMQGRLQQSGLSDLLARGRVLGAVVTEGEFSEASLRTGISAGAQSKMRARVDKLRGQKQLVGIQLWTRSGTLLFAYPDLGASARALAAAEVSQGASRVEVGRDYGSVRADDVLSVLDLNQDNHPDATVVTSLPASGLSALSARYQRRLVVGGGILLALVMGMLLVTRRRISRREREALHDPLTGLGNRLFLTEAAHRYRNRGGGLLLLDLDGFKDVNDTLGHSAGDELLVQVAETLRGAVRKEDCISRLGGDEFAVLLPGLEDAGAAVEVAQGLRRGLAQAGFCVRGVPINVDASIGVTTWSHDGSSVEELLRRADVAMYRAKSSQAGVSFYSAINDHRDTDRLAVLGELRHGIANDELALHYQPLVTPSRKDSPAGSAAARSVSSVEALVRWHHPTRGLLAPDAFVPIAERTGLIHDLTAWVLERAVVQAAAWRRAGLDLTVAVNLSRHAVTPDLLSQVLTVLDAHGLPSTRLKLEVTETAISEDPARTISILRSLRTAGVQISLDDFGAGFTSLAHLTSLPLTELKIDKSFIDRITASPDQSAVVRSMVELAHRLGLIVVAEGVEDAATNDHATALGCDSVQGYFYSRPVPAGELETWLWSRERALPTPRRG